MRPPLPSLPHKRALAAASGMALLLAPLLLSGCSGSRFGEALSRSFPIPGGAASAPSPEDQGARAGALPAEAGREQGSRTTTPAVSPKAAPPAATGSGARPPGPSGPGEGRPSDPKQVASSVAPAGTSAAPLPRTSAQPAAQPAPYRVTLRLPLADPSAPAEGLTEALRAAGVPFEVETIERMNGATAPLNPAPSGPASQVRPAPQPR